MAAPISLDEARYARMRWNTPLSEEHASLLLTRLDVRPGETILDLGCGWGELLLRAVAAATEGTPAAAGQTPTGVGVDTDAAALERGRLLAAARGLGGRVEFVQSEVAQSTALADRVICIGATHAWGGIAQTLQKLGEHVRPGGRLLFGDGCFEGPATPAVRDMFGADVLPLADVVQHAVDTGWRVLHLSTADQREWDDFESTWRAGRQDWLLANAGDNRAAEVREGLDKQLLEYVGTYRGVLGFCYLVLAR